jgi:hypothetical protein
MDDRKFLEKIRRLQESGKRIELTEFPINGKKTLVENRLKSILLENEVQNLQPSEQQEEEIAFKDKVSQLVKFEPIEVHKENVEWQGNLIREKIQWNFSLDEKIGCYIQSLNDDGELTPVQLTDDTIQTIRQLRVYYDVWSDKWASRLTGGKQEEEEITTPEDGEATAGTEGGGFGF